MQLTMRPYRAEEDYWLMRSFLRQTFLLNERLEHNWNVARLDYWRWHMLGNCQVCGPLDQVATIWETPDGQMAAVLHPVEWGEARLHVHPHLRTVALEDEMLAYAEEHLTLTGSDGRRWLYVPVDAVDALRKEALAARGYHQQPGNYAHKWRRDLDAPLPDIPLADGYIVRSMGDLDEHPARSWASWRAFHNDEPDENYDGDWSWFQNVQSAPLYRRDLDLVAQAVTGEIASFCTIFYDDTTRSAVCVLVGTAAEHQRRGLGKAVMFEGLRRLQKMGATRAFATAYNDPAADALYGSVLGTKDVSEAWVKECSL